MVKERITLREREFQIKWKSRSSISGERKKDKKTGSKWNYIFFFHSSMMRENESECDAENQEKGWHDMMRAFFSDNLQSVFFFRHLCRLSFDPEIKISYHHHFQPSSCHFAFHSPFNLAHRNRPIFLPSHSSLESTDFLWLSSLFFVCRQMDSTTCVLIFLLDYKSISWGIYRVLIAFTKN